jgi:hypothetical protein
MQELFKRLEVSAIVFPTTRTSAPRIGQEEYVDIGGRQIDFTRAIAGNIATWQHGGIAGSCASDRSRYRRAAAVTGV